MSSSKPSPHALGRRHWLVATPAAVIVLGWAGHHLWASPTATAVPSAFASLADRRLVRWQVVRVHPVRLGAVAVVLATEAGQRYQVDVLARDPTGPEGVAHTDELSLFVVNSHEQNRESGMRTTDEEQGLGAMVLAQALADEPTPEGLLTHRQRLQRHPRGAFAVPLV